MYCLRLNLVLVMGTLAALVATEIDAIAIPTPKSCLAFFKDLALEKFKAGFEKTAVVAEFRVAVGRIKEQFELAAEQGLFNPENEDEATKYYYQIALAELKLLKQSTFAEEMSKQASEISIPEGYTCKRDEPAGEEADYDLMDMDLDDTGVDRLDLENELDRLNEELESEMGWSMTPEARARMQKQARQLAHEVLQNEVRDLALAAVTGFMAGGVGGAVAPVWGVVAGSLKLKLVRYFMHMVLELLSSCLGQPIELAQPAGATPA